MMKIVLASGSPRRRDLMAEAGYDFTVVSPDVDEIHDEAIPIVMLSLENAKLKANAVSHQFPEAIIIAADTLVSIDGRALAKPDNMDHAFEMISLLNGRTHEVVTAVCVRCGERDQTFTVSTAVTFKEMTDDQLRAYQTLINPLDKAGAYAAQDYGTMIIDRIEGSMTNVIGLPMDEVSAAIEQLS